MNKKPHRLCIRTNDVCIITGYSERRAREIINDIKVFHDKEKHQMVTIYEFCKYMGLKIEEVREYIF